MELMMWRDDRSSKSGASGSFFETKVSSTAISAGERGTGTHLAHPLMSKNSIRKTIWPRLLGRATVETRRRRALHYSRQRGPCDRRLGDAEDFYRGVWLHCIRAGTVARHSGPDRPRTLVSNGIEITSNAGGTKSSFATNPPERASPLSGNQCRNSCGPRKGRLARADWWHPVAGVAQTLEGGAERR